MPLSVRELFLVVRARDEATNTLRRVGQSVARLQSISDIKGGIAAAKAEGGRLAQQRANLESALASNSNQRFAATQKIQAMERSLVEIGNARNVVEARGLALMDEQELVQSKIAQIEKTRATMVSNIPGAMPMATSKAMNQLPLLQKQYASLQAQIEATAAAYNGLGDREAAVVAEMEAEKGILSEIIGEYAALQKQIADLAAEEAALADRTAMLNAQLKAQKFENFNRAAHAAGGLGRTMQYVGAISVAALGFAAHSAANLESSTRLAATQVANTVKGVGREGAKNFDFILQEMRKFPAASSDMSASLYDIFSTLTVNGNQGRKVLDQVNKAAVAGQISVKDATAGVLSVLNNFKLSWRDVPQVLNRSFAAVRYGRLTMDEFQNSLSTTAPAAKNAQQSFNTLAGTVAFLSRSLGPAKAATGFARLTEVLGNQKFLDKMKQMNVMLQDSAGKFLPLNKQIDNLIKRFPYLTQGGSKALNFFKNMSGQTGTIQARRAFVTLVTNQKGYHDILNKTIHDNQEFTKSYKALAASAAVQWGVFLNTLKSVFITIGAAVLPTFVKLVHPLQEIADAFNKLDKPTQSLIGRWIALAAIGVTIAGTILSVGAAIALTLGQIAQMTGAAGPLVGIAGLVPIIAGLAIIGLQIYRNWSTLAPLFSDILGIFKRLYEVGTSIWDAIPGPIKAVAADLLAIYAASRLLVVAWGALKIEALVTGLVSMATAATGTAAAIVGVGVASEEAATGLAALELAMGPVGWVMLGIGIAVVAAKLISMSTSGRTAESVISDLNKSLDQGAQAGKDYASAQESIKVANSAIKSTQASMKGLNTSSSQYQGLLQQLHGLEQQRAADLNASADAMKKVTEAQSSSAGDLAALNQKGVFSTKLVQPTQPLAPAQNAFAAQKKTFDDAEASLSKAITTYKQWLSEGIDPASKGMKDLKTQIDASNEALIKTDPGQALHNLAALTPIVNQFTQALKVVPNHAQQVYLNSIPKSIRGAMMEYTNLTGTILKRPLAETLFKHQDASKAISAFLATTKDKIGSSKFSVDLGKIIKVAPGAQNALANYIKRHGVLPKNLKAFVTLAIKNANKTKADAKKLAQQIAQQQQKVLNLQRFAGGRFGGAAGAGNIGTNISKALDAAKKKLDGFKDKNIRLNATLRPKDPWKPFEDTSKADSAIQGVVQHMSAAGTSAGQGFKQAFDAEAAGLEASGQLTISVFKKSIGAHSPATKFMPAGKSAMQGVILGMVKEAEGGKTKADINSAVKTITDAMSSAWSDLQSTMQSNFGDLFQGTVIQQKVDWGEKLNITDLTKDLKSQKTAFHTFSRDLQKLGGRGAPLGLIQQLEQLGPAANGELEALLHATKPQLRRYFKLYQQSQKDIHKATKNAFDVQRAQWTKHGRDMAVGILLGLRSEQPQLERYFKHLASVLIGSLRKHNKSHSPSMLYFEEGRNMMMGLQNGIDSVKLDMNKKAKGRVYGKHGGGNVYNIDVTANNDETFHTTMRKLEFRLKH